MNRLVVLHDDGTITTCDPEGGDRTVVAYGGPHRLHQQPTWSPDGSRIVFSTLTRAGGLKAAVVLADPDGGDRMEIPMAAAPFYFQWRPDGRAVACLGAGPLGYDLTVVEPGAASRVLTRGSPLFFDWAPDGSGVATHVSEDRLVVATDDGERPLAFGPGTFTAPAWLPAGLVAAVADGNGDGDGERIALIDPAGQLKRTICRYEGYARFVPSPDGRRIAFVCGTLRGRAPVTADVLADTGHAIPDALCVYDLDTDILDVVWSQPPVAFCWSPDGERLLLLVGPDDGRALVRGLVWDGGLEPSALCSYVPTAAAARHYLPFAEQYARSQTPWSPDSTAVCWSARRPDGQDQVWVQPIGSEARNVCPGSVVSWSPS